MRTRIRHTKEYCLMRIEMCQLKFERAMERFDIHEANIACTQKDWWVLRLSEVQP